MATEREGLLQRARDLAEQGSHAQALACYRALCELDPYDPEPWLERASVAETAGLIEEAVMALYQVVDLYGRAGMGEAVDLALHVLALEPRHRGARQFLSLHAPEQLPDQPAPEPRRLASVSELPSDGVPMPIPGPGDSAPLAPEVNDSAPVAPVDPVSLTSPVAPTGPMNNTGPVGPGSARMAIPWSESIRVAMPLTEALPMPVPASESKATPRPAPEILSGRWQSRPRTIDPVSGEPPAGVPLAIPIESPSGRSKAAEDMQHLTGKRKVRAVTTMLHALPSSPLVDELDDEALDYLIDAGRVRRFAPTQAVIRQGEEGASLFILLQGSVDVEREQGAAVVRLSTLPAGSFFGELSLIAGVPRSATVRARERVLVLEVSRKAVRELGRRDERVLVLLMRFFRARLVGTLMATSPLFQPFSAEERRALVSRFRLRELPANEIVLRQGRASDGLYVVLIGTLIVFLTDEHGNGRKLGTLGPGDVFGEMSLLHGERAMASIGTHTRSWLMRLPREDFEAIVAEHPEVLDQLIEIAAQRRARNRGLAPEDKP